MKQQTTHLQFRFFLFITHRRHVLLSKLDNRVHIRVNIGRNTRIWRHSLLEPEGGDIGIRVVFRLPFNDHRRTDHKIDELISINIGEDDSVQTLSSRVVLRVTKPGRIHIDDTQQFALAARGGVHQHHHVVVAVDDGVPVPGSEVDLFHRQRHPLPTTLWS